MITTSLELLGMRHATMAAAAEESDLAQEVFLPIPTDSLRPAHPVMILRTDPPEIKFEKIRRTAELAAAAQGGL